HALAEGGGARRAAPRAHRLARRDRFEPGRDGGRAALRPERAQLRHPGVHAAYRRDRPRVSTRLFVSSRHDASGRCARPRRRYRRDDCRHVSVRTRVSAGQPPARRDGALVVISRRQLLAGLSSSYVVSAFRRTVPSTDLLAASMRFGYAAITWGAAIGQAIDDITAVGFSGILLRIEDFQQ